MKDINPVSVLRSAQRLAEAYNRYVMTGNNHWIWFLQRESTILLKRALKLWIKVRLRRIK